MKETNKKTQTQFTGSFSFHASVVMKGEPTTTFGNSLNMSACRLFGALLNCSCYLWWALFCSVCLLVWFDFSCSCASNAKYFQTALFLNFFFLFLKTGCRNFTNQSKRKRSSVCQWGEAVLQTQHVCVSVGNPEQHKWYSIKWKWNDRRFYFVRQ